MLFRTYLTEQFGTNAEELTYGVDFISPESTYHDLRIANYANRLSFAGVL